MKNENNMKLIFLIKKQGTLSEELKKTKEAIIADSEMFESSSKELIDFLKRIRDGVKDKVHDSFGKIDPTQVDGTDPDFSATNDGYGNVPEFKTTIWTPSPDCQECMIPEGYIIDLEKTTENELHFKKREKKLSDYSNVYDLMLCNGMSVEKTSAIFKIAAVSKFLREPDKIPCFVPCLISDGIVFRNTEKPSPLGFTSTDKAEEALNFLGVEVFRTACQ